MSEHRQLDVHFSASDGATLVGDLSLPSSPRAAVVLLHPHPQYGGNRHNAVIGALHAALPAAEIASFRFDFRTGFTDGPGERLDASAAIDQVVAAAAHVPIALVGYSFGAWIALGLRDDRLGAVVAIAPPLAAMPATPPPELATLVVTPAHDQFSSPAQNQPFVDQWNAVNGAPVEHVVIEMADHFLAGSTAAVAERVTAWIATTL